MQWKHKLDETSTQYDNVMKDVILNNIEMVIANHLIPSFKDNRKTWKTILTAVESKHQQLSRPADIQEAFRAVQLNVPSDSFRVAQELKRLAKYVNGDQAFLVQHFVDSISDYDFKLVIQQRVTNSSTSDIDDLADFLSQMPPKPSVTTTAVTTSKGTNVWRNRDCFNCGKRGHGYRFCRATKHLCETCQKTGHLEQYCRQKN